MSKRRNRKVTALQGRKRLVIAFTLFCLVMVGLCCRVGYIQVVKGDTLKKKAINQQMKDELVEAKRGEITDRNGNKLAVSTIKYSVWARPASIAQGSKNDEEKKQKLAEAAKTLAPILGTGEAELTEKLSQNIALIKIAKYKDNDTVEKIREADISGISVTQETKRAYPLGNFASQVLGSVTDDNNGLSGLEQYYNKELRGSAGRWVQSKDASGKSLFYGEEKYYDAVDGDSIVLTIDEVIQHYAEEQVAKAKSDTGAERVRTIVMAVETGEVLAMASTGGFDPNDPRTPLSKSARETLANLPEDKQLDYLNRMWRNPLVSDVYEPGSTFKLITAAMALEENETKPSEKFHCSGAINVSGTVIKCWRSENPHGTETLTEAVGNSCNPVFVQLATRVGIKKFYDYLELFGIDQETGIDYPGEAKAIFQGEEEAGPVGIATIGFGQGIAITPIQLISAVCSLGNDGILMRPHLVKEIKDQDGNTVKKIEPEEVRQTVSRDTANTMCDIMEYVVEKGGGQTAKIDGYRVGGKTGTANSVDSRTGKYGDKIVGSFIGLAPMDDPKIAVLVIVDDPKGEYHGNMVAAPPAAKIMKKTLRYMNIEKSK